MTRNWLRAFKPAQFRGAAFKVETEAPEGAKRLSVSPIAYSAQSVIEEMGIDPRVGTIRAYCAGDEADHECMALVAAMGRSGAGLLVLPMFPAMRAYVRGWRVVRQLRIAGYVAIDIDFIEEGLSAVPFAPARGPGAAADRLTGLATALSGLAAERFSRASPDRQAAEIAAMRAVRERAASLATLTAAGAPVGDDVADKLTELDAATDPAQPSALAITIAVCGFWRRVGLDGEIDAVLALTSDMGADLATDAGAIETLAIAGAWCVGLVRKDYPAQPDASAAREAAGATAAMARPAAEVFGWPAIEWLNGATGAAARALAAGDADRAPLVRVETQISLDAITLAYDLYGDANRAGELIDRNKAAEACLMPAVLEALAL